LNKRKQNSGSGPWKDFATRVREARAAGMRYTAFKRQEDAGTAMERAQQVMEFFAQANAEGKNDEVVFWICYDVSNNRIRRYLAKFLIKKGCIRVQRSVFLGRMRRPAFQSLCRALHEVNEMYENHDSVIVMPVSTDSADKTRFIGENVSVEWVLNPRRMLWF
jgi:CRISPR-associated protein Cas2